MKPIRVVAFVEADTVTGPAGNLLRFCKLAQAEGSVTVSIAAFHRAGSAPIASHAFFEAVRSSGVGLDIIPERYRFDRAVIPLLRDAAERRGADIIQTHAVKSHFLIRYAGLHRQFRWIAFQHGYTGEDLKMRLYNQLDRWSLPAADRVVAVCGPFAKAVANIGVKPENIHVLPNSIQPRRLPDEGAIRSLREHLGISDSARVILSIGRLSSEKAHSDLLSALLRLKTDDPQLATRLILVGDGIERRNLENIVASSGLADRVIFAGHQSDVWPYFGLADLFVLPSLSEGSPNVLLEAMCAGLPIVATSVGGVPETVENESSAMLVPPRDPGALAVAMRRVLSDPPLSTRLAANASARVLECFSPQSHYNRLLEIYRATMATSRGMKS